MDNKTLETLIMELPKDIQKMKEEISLFMKEQSMQNNNKPEGNTVAISRDIQQLKGEVYAYRNDTQVQDSTNTEESPKSTRNVQEDVIIHRFQ